MSGQAGGQAGERSFEQSLSELERRVQALERGELELEEALRLFEEGVALVRECHDKLDQAEARILSITGGAEGAVEAAWRPAPGDR
jgi:exodeoxyribonuclease VII small subunit